MIELTVLEFLKQNMEIPVSMEHFEDEPERFILFEKTGGSEAGFVNTSMIAVQSYAETLYEAASLNGRVKEIMKRLVELNEVTKVSVNADHNYTDTETKRCRYQAVFEITHY